MDPAVVVHVAGTGSERGRAAARGAHDGAGRPALLAVACVAVLAAPLLVALAALHAPRWYPLLDMAQTEIRVRDVASSHPPLIGLAGRIGPYGADGGSHPGPLSFYAMWPLHRLSGGTAFGLHAAAVALDVAAISLAIWIARRRGGAALVLATAATLAVLMHAYGAYLLTLPWNPYLPVLWWFVFLLAVWSVVLDDLPMLPVAVLAGSFAMQTHIPYLGLVGGMGAATVLWLAARAYRRRGDPSFRRALVRHGLGALALFAVLWAPPVVDEIVHEPGNLTTIRDHFADPPEPPVGVADGVESLLTQMNPWRLVGETLVDDSRAQEVSGSIWPAVALLGALGVSGAAAVRMRHRRLVALHGVMGLAVALGAVSAARIFGYVWYYLLLWAWGLAALAVLAIGWTVAATLRRPRVEGAPARRALRTGALVAGATVLAGYAGALAVDAAGTDVQEPRINETLGRLVGPTADALERRRAGGWEGPVLVTWLPDPLSIGGQGFGMLNELLREGYDARARLVHRPGATRYHVAEPEDVEVEVHVATGPQIDLWRADRRYEEVAYADARSDAERAEFTRLRRAVVADLRAAGLHDLVGRVDDNLWSLGVDERVGPGTREKVARMLEIGMPSAVFVGPPSGSV